MYPLKLTFPITLGLATKLAEKKSPFWAMFGKISLVGFTIIYTAVGINNLRVVFSKK